MGTDAEALAGNGKPADVDRNVPNPDSDKLPKLRDIRNFLDKRYWVGHKLQQYIMPLSDYVLGHESAAATIETMMQAQKGKSTKKAPKFPDKIGEAVPAYVAPKKSSEKGKTEKKAS